MMEPHTRRKDRVFVVIAHPDDEIFVSGTLCLLAEKGFATTIISLTDGENGCRDLIHQRSGVSLASVRRQELRLSAWALGAEEVLSLGYPDVPEQLGPGDWDEASIVSLLLRLIEEMDPHLILTHGPRGGYGHPAHRLVHRLVAAAAGNADYRGTIFSFCGMVEGSSMSRWLDDPSDVLIDASGFLDRRAASLSYHQSQLGYFLQPFRKTMRGYLSALYGYVFHFTPEGRRRIPITSAVRFFRRYPVEGLVLQQGASEHRSTIFFERLSEDQRVKIVAKPRNMGAAARAGGIPKIPRLQSFPDRSAHAPN